MNKKQIICMWIGIVLFVYTSFTSNVICGIGDWYGHKDVEVSVPMFIILWIDVVAVTAGLIYTFRDKKSKDK